MRPDSTCSTLTVSEQPSRRNILLVGDVGVGKSALVNLIIDTDCATTSSGAKACTLHPQEHIVNLNGVDFALHDTSGLHESQGNTKTSNYLDAVHQTYALISRLEQSGGINLLVFCMKGGRISITMQQTYNLFVKVLCNRQVPVVVVVTHLEMYDTMEEWWKENEGAMKEYGLKSLGHACITTTRGYRGIFSDKYEQSREIIRKLLLDFSGRRYTNPPPSNRVLSFVTRLSTNPQPKTASQLERQLRTRCGMDSATAQKLAATLIREPLHTTGYQSKGIPSFNVILFGEAGVGKSSVVNLIADTDVAETSGNAWGCTLESKRYTFPVGERTFNIWDTIGLGEPSFSVTNYLGAILKTYALIQQIEAQGGLDLLLFCIPGSGSRISQTMLHNYRLFFEVLCEKRVPISVVVTRLEGESNMEGWWDRNGCYISQSGLKFGGHACVTGQRAHPNAKKGQAALEQLLLSYDHKGRYPMPPASTWFSGFLERLPVIPRSKALKDKRKEVERLLRDRCMMESADAVRLAESLTHPQDTGPTQ